jgi:hypothetical protein
MSDSFSLKKESFAGIITMKLGFKVETNCQALTVHEYKLVVRGRGQESLFVSVYRVYSLRSDILMWIC